MAQRSTRLKPILRIAEMREQDAARAMSAAIKLIEMQESQLQQVQTYRGEYLQSLQTTGSQGISIASYQSFLQFIRQLDKAVLQQSQAIEASKANFQARREEWLALRTRTNAVQKVKERYQEQELFLLDKQEQALLDDASQRKKL